MSADHENKTTSNLVKFVEIFEQFSKDVELDQVKDLLDPVLRSAVERLDTEAQKKFVETEYERIILETYLTNDLAPKYYAKRYLFSCNRL